MPYQEPNSIDILAKRRPPPLNIGYNEKGIGPERDVLYRNFHEISELIYLVEISRDKKNLFVVLLENFEDPSNNIAESIKIKVASKLMKDNGNLFETFVSQCSVKYGKLQIAGYHHAKKPQRPSFDYCQPAPTEDSLIMQSSFNYCDGSKDARGSKKSHYRAGL